MKKEPMESKIDKLEAELKKLKEEMRKKEDDKKKKEPREKKLTPPKKEKVKSTKKSPEEKKVKPEKKISLQDVMAFQRSTFEGTIYDLTSGPEWLVPDGKGGFIKSPLATPFPGTEMKKMLKNTGFLFISWSTDQPSGPGNRKSSKTRDTGLS